jgi:uncharacterized protein YgbK (DUF1537 family)
MDSLPPPHPGNDFARIRDLVGKGGTKVVVLDDDPTGTQTMHGIDVLSDWSIPSLAAALSDPRPCFYILTNTRSMPTNEAATLVSQVISNLVAAAQRAKARFTVISRSDSTLRGHFAAELRAIEHGLDSDIDATIVVPAFFEGGRYTVGNVHYVAEADRWVPAAETEFAKDRTFGYRHSRLTDWIEEKTGGVIRSGEVSAFDLDMLRSPDGADRVKRILMEIRRGAFVIVNAAAYSDLEVFVHGMLQAEALGKRYMARTAASYVRVRAGLEPRQLLTVREICEAGPTGGLIVVGSYVSKTTAQLEALLALASSEPIELRVETLGADAPRKAEISRVAAAAAGAMRGGRNAVVFTSRAATSALGQAGDLVAGRIVSDALVSVVLGIEDRPRFVVAKGGITSSDLAIYGLGMKKALVLGQAAPGVPVWQMGPETRFPGLRYVVWPGNVGGPDALRDWVGLA